jgi:D-arabinose 1-dehydrogenase-like Zn-dependent alcohol dehydrogenase
MVTTTSLERKKGDVGVVGLGGLGHMGVKFANALGHMLL